MGSKTREWSVPTPLRALLWWPAVSFVLVIVAPETAVGTIVASGALLVVIGGLLSTGAHRLRELRADAAAAAVGSTGGAVADTATVLIEGPAARQAAAQQHPGGIHSTGAWRSTVQSAAIDPPTTKIAKVTARARGRAA